MSNTFLEYMHFKNREQEKMNEQETLRRKKYIIENKPTDDSHILSCNMSDALALVRKDKRTLENTDYIRPDISYK